MPHRYPLRALP